MGDEEQSCAWTIHPGFEVNYEGSAIFHARRNSVGQQGDLALGIPNIRTGRFAVSFRFQPPAQDEGGGDVFADESFFLVGSHVGAGGVCATLDPKCANDVARDVSSSAAFALGLKEVVVRCSRLCSLLGLPHLQVPKLAAVMSMR